MSVPFEFIPRNPFDLGGIQGDGITRLGVFEFDEAAATIVDLGGVVSLSRRGFGHAVVAHAAERRARHQCD